MSQFLTDTPHVSTLTNDSRAALAKPRPDRIRDKVKARSGQRWRNALLCKLEENVDMAGDPGSTQRGPAGDPRLQDSELAPVPPNNIPPVGLCKQEFLL